MKLIAHRSNIEGQSEKENSPEQIDKCINLGYNVEIDIRYDKVTKIFSLGHDKPQYQITLEWLINRSEYLWIHCKNIDSLYIFSSNTLCNFNYFWHQEDDFTLTSNNYIWTYPGKPYTSRSIIVMPETFINLNELSTFKSYDCYGICSDYVSQLK